MWQTALGTNVLTIQSGPKPGTIRNPFTTGLTSHGLTGIGLKSMRFASVQQLSTAITACLERPEIQQKAAMLSRQLAKEPRATPLPRANAPKMGGPFMLVVSNMNFIFHIYIYIIYIYYIIYIIYILYIFIILYIYVYYIYIYIIYIYIFIILYIYIIYIILYYIYIIYILYIWDNSSH